MSIKGALTESQCRFNDSWWCILDNLRTVDQCEAIINLLGVINGKTSSDNVVSASYNWVPMDRQQFLWGLSLLHNNELHCVVSKLSFMRSVYSICPCIQLHQYASNVSQIWLIWLHYNVSFGSLSTGTTQLSNSYCHVRFEIIKYLIAKGYNVFWKWTCHYSWCQWLYVSNHLWCLVGFNQCRLKTFYWLNQFETCLFMVILFALQNWGDQQPWNHMNCLSSSSSPFITTWNQLNGETLPAKSSHHKVKWFNSDGHYRID